MPEQLVRPLKRSILAARLKAAVLSFCFVSFCRPALACSLCGCGDPMAAAGEARPMQGRLGLVLDGEVLTAKAVSDDDPAKTESLTQYTLRPALVYSLTDSMNLVLQVPLVNKVWALTGGASPDQSVNPAGLGDIDLGARFFVAGHTNLEERSTWNAAVSFGSTLPTGGDNILDASGRRIDQHAQLGTGAYGPYAGLVYSKYVGDWGYTANLYARTHSVNAYDYAFGSALTGGLQGKWDLSPWLGLSLALEARYADYDVSNGGIQANTGGSVLDLSPALSWSAMQDLWIQAQVQVPVYTNLFGSQSLGSTVVAGVKYSLF